MPKNKKYYPRAGSVPADCLCKFYPAPKRTKTLTPRTSRTKVFAFHGMMAADDDAHHDDDDHDEHHHRNRQLAVCRRRLLAGRPWSGRRTSFLAAADKPVG